MVDFVYGVNHADDAALPAGYADLLGAMIETAREQVAEQEQLTTVGFLINLERGTVAPVAGDFSDDGMKDTFAEFIRQRASRIAADAIVLISEAWTVEAKTPEEYRRVRQQYPSLEQCPERIEIVAFSLQTHDGEWAGHARIEQVDGGRRMGEVEWHKTASGRGRLVGLLPVRYATPDQCAAYIRSARAKLTAAGVDPDMPIHGRPLIERFADKIRQAPAANLTESMLDDFAMTIKLATVLFRQ